ncbi:MAG TPA: hypothetical protein EYP88_01100 [Anaerolineales bacterium]|nr:hypothetical protein [Anaerolineales bacterium]
MLFENVYKVNRAAVFSTNSGEMLVFAVTTVSQTDTGPSFQDYVVQGDAIIERRYLHLDPPYPPVMVNGEILWARVDGTHVLVENSDQEIHFNFSTYYGASIPLRGFESWDDHWVLKIGDFVVQDGEILNAKLNFQEVFGWHLVNGKPFYFFRRGKRVGISYDGQIWPLYYHDVLRGYCCGLTVNNPMFRGSRVTFFARRDGIWYYVEMDFGSEG